MRYILIEHGEGSDPKRLRIFNTVDARARATREAILGPPSEENKDLPCPELLTLATDGIVDFECDPSIEWIDAEMPRASDDEKQQAAIMDALNALTAQR